MISSGRNCRSSSAYVFTASQWQELEQQLLTFKYIMSGVPVPPELISTVIRNPLPLPCSSSSLFPPHHQPSLPFGWGCFQVGYGRKIDPEPGRCRRTDGKKWRCTKEACPDSKYCERHMHRGKNKTKKPPFQVFPTTSTTPTSSSSTVTTAVIDHTSLLSPQPTTTTTAVKNNQLKSAAGFFTSPATSSCPVSASSIVTTTSSSSCPQYKSQKLQSSSASFYPFLSPNNDQSSSFSTDFTESTQPNNNNNAAPQWLLDPQSYAHPKKEIRYMNEVKGVASERISTPFRDTGYNIIKEEKEERFGFNGKEDETQKQLFHHFLGD